MGMVAAFPSVPTIDDLGSPATPPRRLDPQDLQHGDEFGDLRRIGAALAASTPRDGFVAAKGEASRSRSPAGFPAAMRRRDVPGA